MVYLAFGTRDERFRKQHLLLVLSATIAEVPPRVNGSHEEGSVLSATPLYNATAAGRRTGDTIKGIHPSDQYVGLNTFCNPGPLFPDI